MKEPASGCETSFPSGLSAARAWKRAALRVVFLAAMSAWLATAALAVLVGEGGTISGSHTGVFDLLAAGVAALVLLRVLRENDRLLNRLVSAEATVHRQVADVQQLCGQVENLNAALTVKDRQLQTIRGQSRLAAGLQFFARQTSASNPGRTTRRVEASTRPMLKAVANDGSPVVSPRALPH